MSWPPDLSAPPANAPLALILTGFVFVMADGDQACVAVLEEGSIHRLCCWNHGKRDFGMFEDDDPVAKAIADAIPPSGKHPETPVPTARLW